MKRWLLSLAGVLALTACGHERQLEPAPKVTPLQFEAAAGTGQATILRHGERLSRVLGCHGCHGDDLTGQTWIDEPRVATLYSSNLTRALPAYDDARLERALRLGIRNDGSDLWQMPSELFTYLREPDVTALIAWLRTQPPRGTAHPRLTLGPEGRRMIEAGEIEPTARVVRKELGKGPVRLDSRHDRARYMIRATCSECHGIELEGTQWTEGERAVAPPNLVVVGAYSRDQFRHMLRTGEAPGGRRLSLMREVAIGRYSHFTPGEVDAIYDYLVARANRPQ